jgi:hypothetical protein
MQAILDTVGALLSEKRLGLTDSGFAGDWIKNKRFS